MAEAANAPTQILSLPQGGGALHGLGEKFSADPHTGTGRFTVPIAIPRGRRGHEPRLDLVHSSGAGNGYFGLGWSVMVPGIARQTSHGVPRYDDMDTFILSGAEDLVAVDRSDPTGVRYQPRTEAIYSQIVHRRPPGSGGGHWEVSTRDGVISRYGAIMPASARLGEWRDPAAIVRADDVAAVFEWKLTESRDSVGNLIVYDYDADEGDADGHRWSQPVLRRIRYADHTVGGETRFLASVTFDYEDREDAFSSYRSGFEIRTTRRCRSITTATHADMERLVRRYALEYASDPYSGVSLLWSIQVVGYDDAGEEHRDMPPLEFSYSKFRPGSQSFRSIGGPDPPPASLGRSDYELVDINGDALPDVLELSNTARYWRNRGAGRFDWPRPMRSTPSGLRLADADVQLLDADGDGRADLLAGSLGGWFRLRFDATWTGFRPFRASPTFNLEDPEVRLVDLTGDAVTDLLRVGARFEWWRQDPDVGWSEARPVRCDDPQGLPQGSFTDPRLKLADMTGDGLHDIVLCHGGNVEYWPNLGHGRFGTRVRMRAGPRLPLGYDPARLILGDMSGDGAADLLYVGADSVTVWFNRTGNGWSEPVTVKGTPRPGIADSLRVVDLYGSGTAGLLYSRDPPGDGRPSMFFLDLTEGVKPRLLTAIENNIGAVTRVSYAPSTLSYLTDDADPVTRWRTTLPFVVQVVSTVETIDMVSHSRLVTKYSYHHGHWDGREREFRGFACVEQVDSQDFDTYHASDPRATAPFTPVARRHFAPPVLTKTWFHVGPVDVAGDGEWSILDLRDEYWSGDPPLLEDETVTAFLADLRDPAGRFDFQARRDAVRALSGRVMRTETYAQDGSPWQGRPYTVSEYRYELREESPGSAGRRQRVFSAFEAAERTTRWERGDDPMTLFRFTGDRDVVGQPRRLTSVAMPRRSSSRVRLRGAVVGAVQPDESRILATHTRTDYAVPSAPLFIHDRVAQVRKYELVTAGGVDDQALDDVRAILRLQAREAAAVAERFDALDAGSVRLVGHEVHHYDGAAFVGLECGELGSYGLLTRTANLVFNEQTLAGGYGPWRPDYLGGTLQLPAGAPVGFGQALRYQRDPGGPGYVGGWYADTVAQAYDVQLASPQRRGMVLAIRDALGHETIVTPDEFWLYPASVRDAAGLTTTAEYNYRIGEPSRVIDANGTASVQHYHTLGMLQVMFVEGPDGEGGSEQQPERQHHYVLDAFANGRGPIYVHTSSRIWHANDGVSNDVMEIREYSDGFGRLVQRRVQADELAFGDVGDHVGLLIPDADGAPRPVPGQTGGAATGVRDTDRVVVNGWQVFDNKGRVVEKYEPFFASGWPFEPEADVGRGRRVTMFYDPRGELVLTIKPDGSRRRSVFGIPDDLADPDRYSPSPWVTTVYDENDLAPESVTADGRSLAELAPTGHYHSPTITVVDALGRALCRLVLSGADPAQGGHLTRTTYDTRGNVLEVIDEHGRHAFSYTYDLMNGLLRAVSVDAGTSVAVSDARGNLVHSIDARRSMTLRTYDDLNRPIAIFARDGPDGALSHREQVTYGDQAADRADALLHHRLGRVWRHLDEAGLVVAETYDFTGKLTDQVRRVVADVAVAAAEPKGWKADWSAPGAEASIDSAEYRTSTRFDALGRAVEITAPEDIDGRRARVVPAYGRSGAVRAIVVDDTPYVRLIARNARGQRLLIEYGNDRMTRYAYDADTFRLTRLRTEAVSVAGDVWTGTGAPIQDLTYGYDLVGNVTSIEERVPGCGVAGTADGRDRLLRTFAYDAFYRLTSASGRACADIGASRPLGDFTRCGSFPSVMNQANAPEITTGYRETYTYDPAGNLVDLLYQVTTGTAPPRWHRSFGIGDLPIGQSESAPTNRLTSVANGSSPPLPIAYDDAGNMISQGDSRTYAWDHAGRLVGFREGVGGGASVSARYLYGADGLRVKKWVRRGTTAALDLSTVSIANLTEETRWAERGGGTNTVLHVLDGTNRIAQVRFGPARPNDAGPAILYEFADHLASSSVAVDAAGAWLNREEYFPFGETSFGSFSRKRYRFTGMERDDESGLAYHAARYYAPSHARWASSDPAGLVDARSAYTYVANNPLVLRDPSGTNGEPTTASSVQFDPSGPATGPSFEDFDPFVAEASNDPAVATKLTDTRPTIPSVSGVDYDAARSRGTRAARGQSGVPSQNGTINENHTRAVRNGKQVGLPESELNKPGTFQSLYSRRSPTIKGEFLNGDLSVEQTFTHHNTVERMIDADFARAPKTPTGLVDAADLTHWRTPATIDYSQRGFFTLEFGLGTAGMALTAYSAYKTANHLTEAYHEAQASGSNKPLAQAIVHETGSWIGGFVGGFALGAVAGVETGPGLFVTGLIGGIIGGNAGAYGADASFNAADYALQSAGSAFDAFIRPIFTPSAGTPWRW